MLRTAVLQIIQIQTVQRNSRRVYGRAWQIRRTGNPYRRADGAEDNVLDSLDELEELAETAGAVTVGRIIQNCEAVHPGTYIGKGKIEEVRSLVYVMDATGVICDDELSPAQLNNLERELDCKVMDRTLLILDIFAARAVTSEGKIQVELAQLRYRSARLVGLRESLSRLGGWNRNQRTW